MSDKLVTEAATHTQHTINTGDENSCHRRNSNPHSQQMSGRKPTHQTVRPPGWAK